MKKQETLEENAENKLRIEFENLIRNKTNSDIEFLLEANNTNYISWLESKWQQQNTYSEEEVLVLLHKRDAYSFDAKSLQQWETPKEWFENLKKISYEKRNT